MGSWSARSSSATAFQPSPTDRPAQQLARCSCTAPQRSVTLLCRFRTACIGQPDPETLGPEQSEHQEPAESRKHALNASLDQSTTCLQSQIGRDRHLRRCEAAQVVAASALSVVVGSCPVGTAVNGTLVARPPRRTPVSSCTVGSALTVGTDGHGGRVEARASWFAVRPGLNPRPETVVPGHRPAPEAQGSCALWDMGGVPVLEVVRTSENLLTSNTKSAYGRPALRSHGVMAEKGGRHEAANRGCKRLSDDAAGSRSYRWTSPSEGSWPERSDRVQSIQPGH